MRFKAWLAWTLWRLVPIKAVHYWLLNSHWQLIYYRPEDE